MAAQGWKIRTLYIFAGLVITGLIGLQLYWINNSIKFQNATLERNLKEDVSGVMQDVLDATYCFELNSKAYLKKGEGIFLIRQQWKDGNFVPVNAGGYVDTLNLYNVFYNNKDTVFYTDKAFIDNSYPATVDVTFKFTFPEFYPNIKHFDSSAYNVSNLTDKNFKEILTNKFRIDEAIDLQLMDSLIKTALLRNKLDTGYQAGIRKVGDSRFEYLSPGTDAENLATTNIRAVFMNDNRFNKPYELLLYVPAAYKTILGSMLIMVLSSMLIIVFLIISYIYFVRTIHKQGKLSDMKNTFINNITHEFRTPITNINLAIDNWRDSGAPAGKYYVDIIEEENRHMARNVEQILEIAALEYPDREKKFAEVNLGKLVHDVTDSFKMQLAHTNGQIEFTGDNPGLTYFGEREQLRNMLHNLVDNAIKYSKGPPRIKIALTETDEDIVIQVDDRGIGMSPEIQQHIFNRFYRGHNGDTHDVKGFGLGLSYVKYIVDAHCGKIYVKSRPDRGTNFTIYLPKKNH